MGKSNLMIRMIDIVFILLFGFIAVSQIDTTAAIDPPKSSEAIEGAPADAKTIIIGVKKDGTFPVDGGEQILKNTYQLRRYLLEKAEQAQKKGNPLGVRIRADWDARVEHGLAVAQICRELGLAKGLDVIKFASE